MRTNHGLIEACLAELAGLADAHVANEREAVDARHQRAKMIREMLRQHRHHAVRKIHGRRALARLHIEFAAGTHIMTDVGNRDDEPPAAAAQRFGEHSVVEVFGVRAVDRHERQAAQILASREVRLADIGTVAVRGPHDLGRKLPRQVVPKHCEPHREIGGAHVFEHLDDASLRRDLALRAFRDLDDHIVLVLGAIAVAQRNLDRIPVPRILRRHATPAGTGVPDAADALGRVADAADQARHASPAVVDADRTHLDPIVVHQGRAVGACENQGRRCIVGHDQHFAARAAADPARNALGFGRGAVALLAVQRLAVSHHCRESFAERIALRIGVQAEPLREARGAQGLGRVSQMLEQQFAARDRLRVAGFLEF